MKITLKKAIKVYEPCRLEKKDKRYKKHKKFFKKYGFWPEETWNLDNEIVYFTLIRLVLFRKTHHGIPNEIYTEVGNDKKAAKKWDKILDKIIEGLYLHLKIDWIQKGSEDEKKVNEAKELLFKYFDYLWD